MHRPTSLFEANWIGLTRQQQKHRKLPSNWEKQGLRMVQRAAFLMKAYSIPTKMFVNTDQTDIHLIPTSRARIWTKNYQSMYLYTEWRIRDKLQFQCLPQQMVTSYPFKSYSLAYRTKVYLLKIQVACNAKGLNDNLYVIKTIDLTYLLAKNL